MLTEVLLTAGDPAAAQEQADPAVDNCADLSHRHGEANSRRLAGMALRALGRVPKARAQWPPARATLLEIGHPGLATVDGLLVQGR